MEVKLNHVPVDAPDEQDPFCVALIWSRTEVEMYQKAGADVREHLRKKVNDLERVVIEHSAELGFPF